MSADFFGKLAVVVAEGRNSGIDTLKSYFAGWRPKNPKQRDIALITLIEKLDDSDRAKLVEVVRYCTDLSFFKLLSNLEEGRNGLAFQLSVRDEGAGQETTLINDQEDQGLRQKFWNWVNEHGH